MQLIDSQLLLSASDLINFLECPHLTHLDFETAHGRLSIEPARTDTSELLARKGMEHERAYVDFLRAAGHEVVQIQSDGGDDDLVGGAERTIEAMRAGVGLIYQGVLFDGERWRGLPDFLERVERPSVLGTWSYEVADAKLARRVKPYFLVQLCLYADLLAAVQGSPPEWMHVILGTRARERLRVSDYAAYFRRIRARFESTIQTSVGGTYPEPVDHCGLCRWQPHCADRWALDDHLSLVARIRRSQRVRLAQAGITTVAALGRASEEDRPDRIHEETFRSLRRQARLQVEQRETGQPRYELLAAGDGHGLARLPQPSPGDLFFDMEGDPFFEGGLEYLFGVVWIEDGAPRFRAFWAPSRAEEKHAFEDFIDFLAERRQRDPNLHVYHYAQYEPVALKRLMGLHATREAEVDDLLRSDVLVDLYRVVRESVCISQPSYSLKMIEPFYMRGRETEITEGGDSIIAFEEYLATGNGTLLEQIERYNEDDCRSTWMLRDWLLERRRDLVDADADVSWRPPPKPREPDRDALAELEELKRALVADVPDDPVEQTRDQGARRLLAELLDYHRREAKPAWWSFFERLDADMTQLVELDVEALGGLEPDGDPHPAPDHRRSLIHPLSFPPQEHKVRPGSFVDPATGGGVTVHAIDEAAGRLELRRDAARAAEPLPAAIIPPGPYGTPEQRRALRRLGEDVARRGLDAPGGYRSLRDVITRSLPRTAVAIEGEPLQSGGFDLGRAKQIAQSLDSSYLFVQGPPGSGKTYTGAQLILHLLAHGARVGVACQSHAAINNILCEVERHAPATVPWRGLKKGTGEDQFRSERAEPLIENSNDNAELESEQHDLVAGTAWLFAREGMDQSLDCLVIDEAGQISLADALAMATSARNLILLGDPQQLAQVSQAVHPPGSGVSVLEHLLGEHATIPPEGGLFIDRTRRMHPDVCRFVSEVVYENRLEAIEECARQNVNAAGPLTGTGVRFVPVGHEGNTRQSPEEAAEVARLVDHLLGADYTIPSGQTRPLQPADLMVVAPFNAQVRCLREHLPEGVPVGTVDKFQGQEAAVCFFSMASSSGEEVPRNVDFLFSRNRLNVAVSRARCLAVLVCSPELLTIRCRSAAQMRLVNALCRLVEMAGR